MILPLSKDALFRITISAIAAALRETRGHRIDTPDTARWTPQTAFGPAGLALTAPDIKAASDRLAQFFHLHEAGVADCLLPDQTIGQWVDTIGTGLRYTNNRLTVLTSGSTGAPKACTHETTALMQEVDALCPLVTGRKRIIACVAPHHIYGLLFTALLPGHLGLAVLDGRFLTPETLSDLLEPGDLLVCSPAHWRYLTDTLQAFPEGCQGVTSTAPMPRELADEMHGRGLDRLIEVYGASETAGIGWRDDPAAPYLLFDHWTRLEDGRLMRRLPDSRPLGPVEPMDLLVWEPPLRHDLTGPRRFRPVRRRDNAVQVDGVTVFPERIVQAIRGHDLVADCSVRLADADGIERLKACVVLKDGHAPSPDLVRSIERVCRAKLHPLERPRILSFSTALPDAEAPTAQAV